LEKVALQSDADITIPDQIIPQIQDLQQQLLQSENKIEEEQPVPPPIINSKKETD
jgi:hypothetical protein